MAESFLEPAVAAAIDRVRRQLTPWFDQWAVVRDIRFIAANQSLDVAHGLGDGVVPDGYSVILADGPVFAAPGKPWTDKVAFLQTDAANVRATVVFYTLREEASA